MGAISAKAAPLRRDEALAFIIEHIVRHGFSPTLEEIAQALGGISTARVKELIAQLVKLKAVSKTPGTQRNLRVNDLTACRHHLTEAMRRLRWSAAEAMGDLEAPLPRVDAQTDAYVQATIEDLRNALANVPPAAPGAALPPVPVDRLRDSLNAGIARANRAGGDAGAAGGADQD